MSQENVEIVRRVLTEFDETQQLSDAVAPDFVWGPEFVGRLDGAAGVSWPRRFHAVLR
jgi:hypothetical protein